MMAWPARLIAPSRVVPSTPRDDCMIEQIVKVRRHRAPVPTEAGTLGTHHAKPTVPGGPMTDAEVSLPASGSPESPPIPGRLVVDPDRATQARVDAFPGVPLHGRLLARCQGKSQRTTRGTSAPRAHGAARGSSGRRRLTLIRRASASPVPSPAAVVGSVVTPVHISPSPGSSAGLASRLGG